MHRYYTALLSVVLISSSSMAVAVVNSVRADDGNTKNLDGCSSTCTESGRLDLAVAAADIPLVSPPGPDLTVETIGCDGVSGLQFTTSNVGTESADGFRTKIVFISRATRQQMGRPIVPRLDEKPLLLGPGEWADLSVAVPKACFPEDLPFEQQGCDVLVFTDTEGAVKEPDDANNMARGLCAP